MNRRRKLLLFGAQRFPAEAIALFEAFKTRVEADGGEIVDDEFIKRFYTAVVRADAVDFCNDYSIILLPEARRIASGRVNKLYALFGDNRDYRETEAAFQPEVSLNTRNGRQFILCEGGRGLNGTGLEFVDNFTRNRTFLEMSGVFRSDDETSGNINGFLFFGRAPQATIVRARIGHSGDGLNDNVSARRVGSDSLVSVSIPKIDNYKLLSGRFRYDLGQLRLFRNNVFEQANDNLTAGSIEDEINTFAGYGNTVAKSSDRCLNGDGGFAYMFNAEVPEALQDALGEFALKEYDLPA